MKHPISTIGIDADDTLWHNENLFEEHHKMYCSLLAEYHDAATVEQQLFDTEMRNLELYGYGVKSFTLSCIETAINLTEGKIDPQEIRRIIDRCKSMLSHPVELLANVAATVETLAQDYHLILITKGDLRDQERKIAKSGIAHCFDSVEIVSDKSTESYDRILRSRNIPIHQFMMIGNSLKSDILPVLDLGGHSAYVPYHLTWEHERVDKLPNENERFFQLENFSALPSLLDSIHSKYMR